MRSSMNDEQAMVGGAGVAAFLVLIAVTVGAFLATGAGAFESAATARLAVFLPHDDVAPGSTAEPKGRSFTASTGNMSNAAPACHYDACARAFRSFRSSDCTFQPFEGRRRACTK
jgi:hypothetical protein